MIRTFAPGFNRDEDLAGLPLFATAGASVPAIAPPSGKAPGTPPAFGQPTSPTAPLPGRVEAIPPQDPRVRGTVEEPRLSRQSLAVLERLRQGPAENTELVLIAQRFGARVHDLRGAGFPVVILSRDRETGVTVYALEGT